MSTKISLHFKTKYDDELLQHGLPVRIIRLIANVSFKTPIEWTTSFKAVVDTGNPVTILPELAHRYIDRKTLYPNPVSLSGVGQGRVWAHLAEVEMIFIGRQRNSPPVRLKACLLADNSLPILIGYEDVITELRRVSDYARKGADVGFH